ncbi:hypothetical protein PGTUg99_002568 [Puccinia graminis f. sp. tritici]|uniref:Uncharacterized protein n=1 Tax=Puccinia graminis f. sp. tritici TaxID=56615 RepID=A0A5B0N0E5_PUCGR|nr:hypothetical protein PGTUg99_002568 [Puccinia graminis f. sp. tritici]
MTLEPRRKRIEVEERRVFLPEVAYKLGAVYTYLARKRPNSGGLKRGELIPATVFARIWVGTGNVEEIVEKAGLEVDSWVDDREVIDRRIGSVYRAGSSRVKPDI